LTKINTSQLTLSGSNTYTGPTLITQGVLAIGHSNGLGASPQTTVSSGAALQLQGGISIGALPLSLTGTGVSSGGALRNVSGNNSWAGTVTLVTATTRINSDSGILTLGGSSSISSTNLSLEVGGNGSVVVSGAISLGNGTLSKDGVGRLTLAGVNVYSGVTSVGNGTLRLANSSGLGSSSMTTVSSDATVELIGGVSVGNALRLSGWGVSSGGALRNVSGNNSWTGSITVNSAATRITSDVDVLDIVGVMSGSGSAGVRYGGAGTVKVSGTSTYTGVSEISTGATLLLGNNNVLSSSSNVLFSGGKLLSDGKSVSAGTLSVSSSSELVLGSGSHTVRFSGPGTFSFTRLVIKGWEGIYSGSGSAGTAGQFFVGSSAVLSREQLDQIQFVDSNNVSYYAVQLGTGEVVPGVGTLSNPTGNSNIQVTTSATVGGSWSGLVSGTYTFTPSADNANINVVDITNRLRGTGTGIGTPGNVKIVTANVGVGTQVGNVNFVANVTVSNPYTARYGLQVLAGGDIVLSSQMSLDGESWSSSSNFGYDVDFSAVGNVLLNSSISTSGQNVSISSQSARSNGGNVVLSAGGYVKVGGSITASGGINSGTGGTNSNGGNVNITGAGGVTMTSGITTLGLGGTAGSITINTGNGTVSSGAGTGVNDGQVSGVLQGGNFVKTGAGIFVLKGSNTYSGTTTISGGILRLGGSNSMPTSSGLVLAGGEFQSAGFSNTFASIALSANSTLRMGSGVHTLTFTNLGSFTSGRTLTIEDWQGTYASPGATGTAGKIVFNATTSATITILGQLKFKNSGTGNLHTSIQLGTKEIVSGNQ
jgi:autotransporter-associated beta strand protein